MRTEKIIIDTSCLTVFDESVCKKYKVEYVNDGGDYGVVDEEGETCLLKRSELKKLGNIKKIDEALEMLRHKEMERTYTDDGLNFIDEFEFNGLQDKDDYYTVEFIVEE